MEKIKNNNSPKKMMMIKRSRIVTSKLACHPIAIIIDFDHSITNFYFNIYEGKNDRKYEMLVAITTITRCKVKAFQP